MVASRVCLTTLQPQWYKLSLSLPVTSYALQHRIPALTAPGLGGGVLIRNGKVTTLGNKSINNDIYYITIINMLLILLVACTINLGHVRDKQVHLLAVRKCMLEIGDGLVNDVIFLSKFYSGQKRIKNKNTKARVPDP